LFDSKYTYVNFEKLKHHPILNFKKDEDIIASVNGGEPIGYGNICVKIAPPAEIQYVSNDEIYLEKAVNYTLVAVAQMIVEENQEIMLGIDMTTDNIDKAEKEIIEKVKGKHEVIFYNTMGKEISKKTFKISKVGVWYQCWIGFMSQVIKDDFSIDIEWADKEILAIDIGRRTAIAQYITTLSPVENVTFRECGSEKFFKYFQEELKINHKITKATHEIEKLVRSGKGFSKAGKKVDVSKSRISALRKYEDGLRNSIIENFGKYDPEQIVFMGGGAILFETMLKQMYENAIILPEPLYRNSEGLVKLVVRKFLKNKKGID
jgi:Ser-tRNA(Ala) deacylase AlaX